MALSMEKGLEERLHVFLFIKLFSFLFIYSFLLFFLLLRSYHFSPRFHRHSSLFSFFPRAFHIGRGLFGEVSRGEVEGRDREGSVYKQTTLIRCRAFFFFRKNNVGSADREGYIFEKVKFGGCERREYGGGETRFRQWACTHAQRASGGMSWR